MTNITSFEMLDQRIKMASGEPTVLEALWDGDTGGWYLLRNLYVIVKSSDSVKSEVRHLGRVSFGGDMRLFTGEVPAWPEAELVKEWGRQANEKYGLIFYFPSDKEPDDDCPDSTQRHLA